MKKRFKRLRKFFRKVQKLGIVGTLGLSLLAPSGCTTPVEYGPAPDQDAGYDAENDAEINIVYGPPPDAGYDAGSDIGEDANLDAGDNSEVSVVYGPPSN